MTAVVTKAADLWRKARFPLLSRLRGCCKSNMKCLDFLNYPFIELVGCRQFFRLTNYLMFVVDPAADFRRMEFLIHGAEAVIMS